jgi:hypothetical protein
LGTGFWKKEHLAAIKKVYLHVFKINIDFFCESSRLDGAVLIRIISKGVVKFE